MLKELRNRTCVNPIHFRKWSNTSYAVFRSIGRVIHIRFLSTIIHGLATVKASIVILILELFKRNAIQEETVIAVIFDDESDHQIREEYKRFFSEAKFYTISEAAISIAPTFFCENTQRSGQGLFSFVELPISIVFIKSQLITI